MLHHVSIEVFPADAERWVELLGLIGYERIEAPAVFEGRLPWYERAGTQVHLIPTAGATAPPLGHAAFVAADFDSNVADLEQAGFTVESHSPLWGARRSFVLAPSGHRVELMETPPPPAVCADPRPAQRRRAGQPRSPRRRRRT